MCFFYDKQFLLRTFFNKIDINKVNSKELSTRLSISGKCEIPLRKLQYNKFFVTSRIDKYIR